MRKILGGKSFSRDAQDYYFYRFSCPLIVGQQMCIFTLRAFNGVWYWWGSGKAHCCSHCILPPSAAEVIRSVCCAWYPAHTLRSSTCPFGFLRAKSWDFFRVEESKFQRSVICLSWTWKNSCRVCILYTSFLCLPLSFHLILASWDMPEHFVTQCLRLLFVE